MKTNLILFFTLSFLVLPIFSYAQDDTAMGCCINPGAIGLSCATDQLSGLSQCCPTPETPAYYDSSNSQLPDNVNDCQNNFFFSGQSCGERNECNRGCCCSGVSGEVKSQVQCSSSGQTFYEGETDCNQICNIPECNDGINNDPQNNDCKDFPEDFGCSSGSDTTESGGTCSTTSGSNCDNINYVPKLTNFFASAPKGEKRISLNWETECNANLISTDILRCTGQNCDNFKRIGTVTQNNFIDDADEIKFDTFYTYKIESHYSVQTATPTTTTISSLGDLECWNKIDDNNFCISESYYNQYRDYILRNFAGFSSNNFLQSVRSTFSDKLNKAYFCNEANKLKEEGTVCSSNEVCVVANSGPTCLEKSLCTSDETNLFGLFSTASGCEDNKYCFF